jgi:hypothetical protein
VRVDGPDAPDRSTVPFACMGQIADTLDHDFAVSGCARSSLARWIPHANSFAAADNNQLPHAQSGCPTMSDR